MTVTDFSHFYFFVSVGSDFMSGLGASKERDATEPGEERVNTF